MTPRTQLPSEEAVHAARTALLAECTGLGTRPTVIALARRLGMTNPTFWRHFPDTAQQIAALGRFREDQPDRTVGRLQKLEHQNAELRRTNRALTDSIKLAEAVIQRLATEKNDLQRRLEAIENVTNLSDRRRG